MERIINKPALIDPHWSWNCQIGEIRYNAANLYNSTSYTIPQVYFIYFICTQFEMKPTIQYFLFFTHYDCNYFWEEWSAPEEIDEIGFGFIAVGEPS